MSHFQKRLQLFRIPAFRWYLLSCILATVGGGLSYIAITWLTLQDSNSVGSVAIMMMCFWLPGVILGPYMGVLVDRINARHHLIASSNIIRAVALLSFGYFLLEANSLTAIYCLAIILGTFFSILFPASFRFVREIVPEKDLLYANATIDMTYEVGNIVGMGFAGLCIALFKAPGAIMINGGILLLSGITLFFIRKKDIRLTKNETPSLGVINDIKTGLQYLLKKRILLIAYTIQLLFFVEYLTAPVLLAPFAKNLLHASPAQFGYIEGSLSIGAVLGGLLIPWLSDKIGFIRTVLIASATLCVGYIIFSYNRFIPTADILYFIIGITFGAWALILTKAQNMTDIQFQGRVQSCFSSISGLVILLVYLSVKLLSHDLALQDFFWLEALFTLAAIFLLWRYRDALRTERE